MVGEQSHASLTLRALSVCLTVSVQWKAFVQSLGGGFLDMSTPPCEDLPTVKPETRKPHWLLDIHYLMHRCKWQSLVGEEGVAGFVGSLMHTDGSSTSRESGPVHPAFR